MKLQERRGPDDCDIAEGQNFIFGHKNAYEKWLNSEKLSLNHSNAMKIWMLINIELFMKKYF